MLPFRYCGQRGRARRHCCGAATYSDGQDGNRHDVSVHLVATAGHTATVTSNGDARDDHSCSTVLDDGAGVAHTPECVPRCVSTVDARQTGTTRHTSWCWTCPLRLAVLIEHLSRSRRACKRQVDVLVHIPPHNQATRHLHLSNKQKKTKITTHHSKNPPRCRLLVGSHSPHTFPPQKTLSQFESVGSFPVNQIAFCWGFPASKLSVHLAVARFSIV